MNVEDLMRYMLNLFDNTAKNLSAEYDKLSQKDLELCDLDHYIENHKLRGGELAKVGKLRKELREERRQIKYDIAYLEIVKKFTDKYNNKLITGDIIQNLKEQERQVILLRYYKGKTQSEIAKIFILNPLFLHLVFRHFLQFPFLLHLIAHIPEYCLPHFPPANPYQ